MLDSCIVAASLEGGILVVGSKLGAAVGAAEASAVRVVCLAVVSVEATPESTDGIVLVGSSRTGPASVASDGVVVSVAAGVTSDSVALVVGAEPVEEGSLIPTVVISFKKLSEEGLPGTSGTAGLATSFLVSGGSDLSGVREDGSSDGILVVVVTIVATGELDSEKFVESSVVLAILLTVVVERGSAELFGASDITLSGSVATGGDGASVAAAIDDVEGSSADELAPLSAFLMDVSIELARSGTDVVEIGVSELFTSSDGFAGVASVATGVGLTSVDKVVASGPTGLAAMEESLEARELDS